MAIITPKDYATQAAIVGYSFSQVGTIERSGNATRYRIFARMRKNATNTATNATFLLVGVTSWMSSNHGVYIVQATTRSNNMLISGVQLAPAADTVSWGYYDGGDGYWYIGVQTPSYAPRATVYLLQSDEETSYPTTVGQYGSLDTAPEGWTEDGFSVSQDNIIRTPAVVNVASISELKTQISAWYTAQGVASVGFYNVAFTTAASPFSAGARVSIQINAAANANNGVAILTYYGASSPEMYLMRLYNGTWGDPKKVTSAT